VGDGTGIEWTEATWNVVTGCTKVSEGCRHCYIDRTPPFRMAGRKFDGDGIGATTDVQLHPDRLLMWVTKTRPRRIFVNSLSDLFHAKVPDWFIARTFAAMALAPQHTFQLLTKRPARMRSLLASNTFVNDVKLAMWGLAGENKAAHKARQALIANTEIGQPWWPLPNLWVGTSVEDQKAADLRIPLLLKTPAAVRFLSCEPLLGPVSFRWAKWVPLINGHEYDGLKGIDWVIVGGESGPKARPMHPDWARTIRDQCVAAGVAFHFKQWGEWQDGSAAPGQRGEDHIIVIDGRHEPSRDHWAEDRGRWTSDLIRARDRREPGTERAVFISRVGKKSAGRELDGRTWDEYPAVTA
jgi:protein gp37